MKVDFEYGQGLMSVNLPEDRTDVFIPGVTVPDPDHIPEENVIDETRKIPAMKNTAKFEFINGISLQKFDLTFWTQLFVF